MSKFSLWASTLCWKLTRFLVAAFCTAAQRGQVRQKRVLPTTSRVQVPSLGRD